MLTANLAEMTALVRPGDIVLLHDPQTAGLACARWRAGARVIWRSHIGRDGTNEATGTGWAFLRPHLAAAHALRVLAADLRAGLGDTRQGADHRAVDRPVLAEEPATRPGAEWAVLAPIGLIDGAATRRPAFTRRDGTPGRSADHATISATAAAGPDEPLVVQVSRWDRLKDMPGVHVRSPSTSRRRPTPT